MSDLQCPASFVLLTPETADTCDLSDLRLSLVLCTCATHTETVQRLAAKDHCTIETSTFTDAAALKAKIDQLADQYRGEQVAVIAEPEMIRDVLKQHAVPTSAVQIAVDSDGWNIRLG
ncbi:MAG TPA: hypothetical protein VFN67_38140 [Polyangiales bacterium]|nr:hypothetical protein [Polyangiales bacterium]